MAESVKNRIASLASSNEARSRYLALFTCIALVVVGAALYIVRRQGMAMVHQVSVLDCPYDGFGAHTHNADCYDEGTNLVCPLEERELHTHDESCYVEETTLICDLEEHERHEHTDDCYDEEGELICGYDEDGIHTHTDECYDEQGELICTLVEGEPHQHTDDCYKVEYILVCDKEEVTEEHVHGPGCFRTIWVDAEGNEVSEEEAARINAEAEMMDEENMDEEIQDEDGNAIDGEYAEGDDEYAEDGDEYAEDGDEYAEDGDEYAEGDAEEGEEQEPVAEDDQTADEDPAASAEDAGTEDDADASEEPTTDEDAAKDEDAEADKDADADADKDAAKDEDADTDKDSDKKDAGDADAAKDTEKDADKDADKKDADKGTKKSEPMPAQTFDEDLLDEDGNLLMRVHVEAPEGAFPKGTTVKVRPVDAKSVEEEVGKTVKRDAKKKVSQIQAVDISFYNKKGEEIEPARQITVKLSSGLVKDDNDTLVVHMTDEGEGELVSTFDNAEIEERDLQLEHGQLVFETSSSDKD